MQKLIIGTRGSKLALKQAEYIATALTSHNSQLKIETKIITTRGDVDHAPIPADAVGKAWFTTEIEQALQSGNINLAIHSLKDLPPELPAGLITAPVLERGDPRDVLIARTAGSLADLPPGAVIGTDSLRRKALLLHQRPDLVVKSIRGNVDTRLRKLHDQDYDALVLAAAGLERLGLLDLVTEYFNPTVFIPAVGQGVLAAEARADDAALWELLKPIQHPPTQAAVAAEQAFTRVIGGGCKLPVGCYVRFEAGTAHVHGMAGSDDASQIAVESTSGPEKTAIDLAEQLAHKLLAQPFMAGQPTNATRE